MDIMISALILEITGAFILTLVAIFDYPHTRIYEKKRWWERYWWSGWRPIFRVRPPNEKARWRLKWNSFIVRYGFIPPKHQWNIIGFLCILAGFILQIKFYLN